jgi:NAD(P)-dependent dehydrogenase (short-subunit alcohol dehydrogenase family)
LTFARYPSLENRVVLITGGGSGIGAAMVEAFCAQGAKVAFLDIEVNESRKLVVRLEGAPQFLSCDLTDIEALRRAIDEVSATLGPIRVLVNNAADDRRHDANELSPDDWDASMAVNLRHLFFAAQAVRPGMVNAGGGSIINFSSVAWMFGGGDLVAYATAKAGIVGMTNSLARKFGDDDIRVNAIAPGAVMTEKQLRLWYDEKSATAVAERQVIKRRLEPEEIARAALFLASDDSRMITKQCLVVDAGLR